MALSWPGRTGSQGCVQEGAELLDDTDRRPAYALSAATLTFSILSGFDTVPPPPLPRLI